MVGSFVHVNFNLLLHNKLKLTCRISKRDSKQFAHKRNIVCTWISNADKCRISCFITCDTTQLVTCYPRKPFIKIVACCASLRVLWVTLFVLYCLYMFVCVPPQCFCWLSSYAAKALSAITINSAG